MPTSQFDGCRDLVDLLDRLPRELDDMVFALAGLHARFLLERLPLPLSPATEMLLWMECFVDDDVRLVPHLPRRRLGAELVLLRSPEMLRAVQAVRELSLLGGAGSGDASARLPGTAISVPMRLGTDLVQGGSVRGVEEHLCILATSSVRACELLVLAGQRLRPFSACNRWRRLLTAVGAAGCGDVPTLERALAHLGSSAVSPALVAAGCHGQMAVLDRLCSEQRAQRAFQGAVRGNRLDVVQILCERHLRISMDKATLEHIVAHNLDAILRWLIEARPAMRLQMLPLCELCILHDNLPMLEFAISRGFGIVDEGLTSFAADGNLGMIQFVHERLPSVRWPAAALDEAAKHGHLAVVEYLDQVCQAPASTWAMDWAAEHGHLAIVRYLHEHRAEGCTVRAMDWAAENGHLATLEFLHLNRTEGCTTEAFDQAALHNQPHVLRFLSAHRTEGFSAEALAAAVATGHHGLVQLMLDAGCVVSTQACRAAIEACRFDMAELLAEHAEGVDWRQLRFIMFWSTPTFSTADIPDLAGKVVIVTGGSSGLGFESAVALAAKGAHVIVSCRNEDKGNAAVADIKAKAGVPAATVEFGVMEQSDLASVRRFADWFLAKGLRLDVLMLNAGVGGVPFKLIDGIETHIL
ncbi:hypothetical protein HK105_208124, partial [Polyrhizophydium stewartii]